jgi:hypothetical protein
MDDASKLGIKNLMKNDFETEFPEATDAKWGFWKGRARAILRYESVEKARTLGKTAAEEQTELIGVVEKNIAHGSSFTQSPCLFNRFVSKNCSSPAFPKSPFCIRRFRKFCFKIILH